MKTIITILLVLVWADLFSQGHIDHIKNQEYMKLKDQVDCNNSPGDNLSEKICANIAFQKSDSLLAIIYDSLILKAKTKGHDIDSLEYKIIKMQTTWRAFRDQHCAIIYENYGESSSGHLRAIDWLYCLRELTEDRIKELRKLNEQIVDLKDSVSQNKNINLEEEKIIGKIGFIRENEDSIELGLITNARIFKASKTNEKFETIKIVIKEASERDIPIELTVENNSIMDAKIPKDE